MTPRNKITNPNDLLTVLAHLNAAVHPLGLAHEDVGGRVTLQAGGIDLPDVDEVVLDEACRAIDEAIHKVGEVMASATMNSFQRRLDRGEVLVAV